MRTYSFQLYSEIEGEYDYKICHVKIKDKIENVEIRYDFKFDEKKAIKAAERFFNVSEDYSSTVWGSDDTFSVSNNDVWLSTVTTGTATTVTNWTTNWNVYRPQPATLFNTTV